MCDHGIFYEFMPVKNWKRKSAEQFSLMKWNWVKIMHPLLLPTADLWRYLLGDTIQFTSLKPFQYKSLRPNQTFINAFGEEVIVDNADKAIALHVNKQVLL